MVEMISCMANYIISLAMMVSYISGIIYSLFHKEHISMFLRQMGPRQVKTFIFITVIFFFKRRVTMRGQNLKI